MEYRSLHDPSNSEFHYLFGPDRLWREESRRRATDVARVPSFIDPVKHPIRSRIVRSSFILAVVAGIFIGVATPQGF